MALDEQKEEKFREAYAVLYRDEAEIQEAMKKHKPIDVIPNVSNPAPRRALVKRLLENKKRETDPFSTSHDFHFDDIKYLIGDTPLDIMLYGIYHGIPILDKINSLLEGEYDTSHLVFNAIENTGINPGRIIVSRWDDEREYSEGVHGLFYIEPAQLQLPWKQSAQEGTPETDLVLGDKAPVQERVDEGYSGPLLVVQNRIAYGRKQWDLKSFMLKNKLGIYFHNLVFNFIGEIVIDPYTVPGPSIRNVLRLI